MRAERPTEHPDDAERRDGPERPPAVAGRDPGQAEHRQGHEDEHGDDEHHHADEDQVRAPCAPIESRSVSMPIPA